MVPVNCKAAFHKPGWGVISRSQLRAHKELHQFTIVKASQRDAQPHQEIEVVTLLLCASVKLLERPSQVPCLFPGKDRPKAPSRVGKNIKRQAPIAEVNTNGQVYSP